VKRDYKQQIISLVESCKKAASEGATIEDIRVSILPARLREVIRQLSPQDFLSWIRDDREYSFFYYDAEEDRVCAKPAEAAAMILEKIVLDNLEPY